MARDYSDTLRAVGRFLDEEGATGVKVVDAGEHLSVSWRGKEGAPEERGYRSFELDELRDKARLMRSSRDGTPSVGMAEILRTLGWILDQMRADLVSITEEDKRVRLVAIVNGQRASRDYDQEELRSMVEQQRQGRIGQSPLAARALGPIPTGD